MAAPLQNRHSAAAHTLKTLKTLNTLVRWVAFTIINIAFIFISWLIEFQIRNKTLTFSRDKPVTHLHNSVEQQLKNHREELHVLNFHFLVTVKQHLKNHRE